MEHYASIKISWETSKTNLWPQSLYVRRCVCACARAGWLECNMQRRIRPHSKLGCVDSNRINRFLHFKFSLYSIYIRVQYIVARLVCSWMRGPARRIADHQNGEHRAKCSGSSTHFVDSRLGCISGRAHQQSACSCTIGHSNGAANIIAIQLRQYETDWRKRVSKKIRSYSATCSLFG